MVDEEPTPKCDGCGTTEGLFFFPRHGFFLCEPCAGKIARILELCQGGLTKKGLAFKLAVDKDQGRVKSRE